jgi:hypothetical protein
VEPEPADTASASDAAMLLLMATEDGGTIAEAIRFRQLVATTRAIYGHTVIDDARQATRIADAVGARLDSMRARPHGRTVTVLRRATVPQSLEST